MSEFSGIIDNVIGLPKQGALSSAVTSMEDDPEQASRAMKLSEASGADPTTIFADVEGFDKQFKGSLTSQIIRNNQHLQDYINSHPMASKVSNDDWGQLDVVSEHLKPFGDLTAIGTLKNFAKGFSEGVGPGGVGEWLRSQPGGQDFAQRYPYSAAAWYALGAPIEVPMRLLGGGIHGGAEAVSGWIAGLAGIAGVEGTEDLKEQAKQTIITSADMYFAGRMSGNIHPTPGVRQIKAHNESLQKSVIDAYTKNLDEVETAIAPYVEAGEPIPPGLHPALDKIKVEQAKLDSKALDDAFKEAQKSATRERSAELFQNFARQHTDAKIGISADAIRELYKDKEPVPEDGILGWVPDIAERLREAEAIGGDVEIPLADALARIDPQVYKELHDDIRVRPGGVTINEGKELKEPTKIKAQEDSKMKSNQEPDYEKGHMALQEYPQVRINELEDANNKQQALIIGPKGTLHDLGDITGGHLQAIYDMAIKEGIDPQTSTLGGIYQGLGLEDYQRQRGFVGVTRFKDSIGINAVENISPAQLSIIRQLANKYGGTDKTTFNVTDRNGRDLSYSTNVSDLRPFIKSITAIRSQAALNPLFSEGPTQQLKLKKVQKTGWEDTVGKSQGHNFAITDEKGRDVGQLLLQERHEGKDLFVEWVGGGSRVVNAQGGVDNVFGPKLMRGLLEQLKTEFPNAEFISGHRVSGAREKAGTEQSKGMVRIPIKALREEHFEQFSDLLKGGEWEDFGGRAGAFIPKEWTPEETKAIEAGIDVLDKIIQKNVQYVAGRKVELEGREVRGLHLQYAEELPIIAFSVARGNDVIGTVKHEAIHQLRQYGLFTEAEWQILEDAAVQHDWLDRHNINTRYRGENFPTRLEEAIAEEFGQWDREPKSDHPTAKIFQKLKDLLDQIKQAIKSALGFEPTWQDLFKKAESGEVGQREGTGPLDPNSFKAQEQPELPGVIRQEDLDLFAKAKDIGMNAKQYKRYQELIERRDAEDIEAQLKRSLKEEERRQTKEWKDNEVKVRDEVSNDIEARPDMAVGAYFRNGVLYGEDTHSRPKLNSERLTDEQRRQLPGSYYGDRGIDPDDVAGLFGYQSGSTLIDSLIKYEKDRGDLSHNQYKAKVIDLETSKRMERQFGDLDQNILSEAWDHVLSTTQMDILHEETVSRGMAAGSEMPFSKNDIQSWIKTEFAKSNASSVKVSRYLDSAGRAGRKAELALLEDDPKEAFKSKQQQYFSALLAREAVKFEKEKDQFDRQMKKFSARQVAGTEQEFTNFIHALMSKAEIPVRRSVDDIAYEIEKSGYDSFDDFVASKSGQGWPLEAPDYILAGDVKPLDQMSVQEFREFRDVTKSMAYIGSEVNKIEVRGKKMDFAEWKQGVLENITTLPPRAKEKQRNILFGFDAELTRLEEVVKDLDLRRELGPLYNGLIRPMMEAKHKEFQLQERLVKDLTAVRGGNKEWRRTLNDSIPQEFFIDPDTGIAFDLSREHMINIMSNWGSRSGIDKFTQGWFGKDGAKLGEQQFDELFKKHATKEDWDFAKKVGAIFEGWREDADNMYRNLSGIAPKWLDIGQDGWYYPVMYDRYYSDINSVVEKTDANALFNNNYFRATTSNGYTNTRTGYVGRIEFQNPLEQLSSRMQQMIHDISYRPAVMQAAKIVYDKDIKAAIRKHYGSEYEAQLDPWLRAIANHYNVNEREISQTNALLRRVRMNLVVNALGLSLKQLFSPDIGVATPASLWRAAKFLDEDTKIAMEKSREIPHTMKVMDRDFRESLDRTIATQGLEGIQASAARFAFIPMAKLSQRFRIATWTQKYKDGLQRGLSDADAVEVADSFVRERHGATGIPDMPAIMRGSETRKLITLFYGFGNATYNWQRQIPGAVKRGDWESAMASAYGAVLIPSAFGIALYNSRNENDSWFKILSKGLALQIGQTVAHARDVVSYIADNQSPRSPIASAAMALKSAASDAYKSFQDKKPNKPIQHAANVIGLGLGVPGAQIGRTAQFLNDVRTGKQKPKNFQEYLRGIIHGEAKLKK